MTKLEANEEAVRRWGHLGKPYASRSKRGGPSYVVGYTNGRDNHVMGMHDHSWDFAFDDANRRELFAKILLSTPPAPASGEST